MEKMYEYIVNSRATNAKYINVYQLIEEYGELHITDGQEIDICIYFDKEDFEKITSLFWTFSYTGRDKSSIQIYAYQGRNNKIYLKHLIMNNYIDDIIPLNRNQCDFRKCNLSIGNKVYGTSKIKQKQNKDLPNNIFYIKQKDGKITGYKRQIKEGDKIKQICFSIKKYQTLENCFDAAIQYNQ